MVDNTVTIRLNLDTTQFNAGLAEAKRAVSGIGGVGGKGSSSGGGASGGGGGTKTEAYLASMLSGNKSSFNVLGGMKGIMGASLGALGTIGIGVAALVVGISAISLAVKPVQKILEAIGKILGAALIPISMIIVTLLKPLIWLLLPFVRLMMTILYPLRKAIQNYMSSAAARNALKNGNIGEFQTGLTGAIGRGLFATLLVVIQEQLKMNIDIMTSLLKILVRGLFDAVANLVNTIGMIVSVIPGGQAAGEQIKGIAQGIAQARDELIGYTDASGKYIPGTLDKVATALKKFVDDITKETMKLLGMKDLMPGGVGTGAAGTETEEKTNGPLDQLIETLGSLGTQAGTTASDVSSKFLGLVGDTYNYLAGDENSVKSKALIAWNKMLTDANTIFPLITSAFAAFLNAIIGLANQVIRAINKLFTVEVFGKKVITTDFKPIEEVGDAIISPTGRVVSTAPDDYLIATKTPGSLGGSGNVTNITINVEGNVDDKTRRVIIDEVQRVVAYQWRSIAR